MDFKIDVLESLAIFPEKQLCWSLFLIKLQVCFSVLKSIPDVELHVKL